MRLKIKHVQLYRHHVGSSPPLGDPIPSHSSPPLPTPVPPQDGQPVVQQERKMDLYWMMLCRGERRTEGGMYGGNDVRAAGRIHGCMSRKDDVRQVEKGAMDGRMDEGITGE